MCVRLSVRPSVCLAPKALEYASVELRACPNFALEAVAVDERALEYAAVELRGRRKRFDVKKTKKNGVSIFQLPGCYPGPWAVEKAPGGSWHEFSQRGVQIRARGTELCSFLWLKAAPRNSSGMNFRTN